MTATSGRTPPDRVLVIDDNPTNLKLASTVLAADGFAVTTAQTVAEAVASIEHHPPAVAFCDIQLPDGDGVDLARRIKSEPDTAHIVVVALTALAMEADRRRALDAGCDAFIAKPIDTRTLGTQTRELLRQAPR